MERNFSIGMGGSAAWKTLDTGLRPDDSRLGHTSLRCSLSLHVPGREPESGTVTFRYEELPVG